MLATVHTDHTVYILGAGFSRAAGMPVVVDFLQRMQDSVRWLNSQGRTRESSAIDKVLDYRLRSAAAGLRMQFDPDNVEELFSLSSAEVGNAMAKEMVIAMAATLDYSGSVAPKPTNTRWIDTSLVAPGPNWTVDPGHICPAHPELISFAIPTYELMAGVMSSRFGTPNAETANTVITFNYDLVLEDALTSLGVPYSYGFPASGVNYHATAPCAHGLGTSSTLSLLKMHGSVNWCTPSAKGSGRGGWRKMRVFGTYADALAGGEIVMVPPTWRKSFDGQLGTVWERAVAALRTATRIVIVGFSLPRTDQHFRYLLAAGLSQNISLRRIVFVNPAADELRGRVLEVFRPELQRGILSFVSTTADGYFLDAASMEDIGRAFDPRHQHRS